jgi:hypothetical protein
LPSTKNFSFVSRTSALLVFLFDEILRSEKEKLRGRRKRESVHARRKGEAEGQRRTRREGEIAGEGWERRAGERGRRRNERGVGEAKSELVKRSDVLLVEVAVVDEVALAEDGNGVDRDRLVVMSVRVVVGDVGGDGEGELATRVDLTVKDGGDGISSLHTGEIGEKDGGNVRMVDPLAEVDRSRGGHDDDGVVVAGSNILDEPVATVGELRERKKKSVSDGKGREEKTHRESGAVGTLTSERGDEDYGSRGIRELVVEESDVVCGRERRQLGGKGEEREARTHTRGS